MITIELKTQEIRNEMSADENGVVTFSIRAVSRIVGVGNSTLIEAFSPARVQPHPLAKILAAKGFNVIGFANGGVPDIALSIIADYYAFEAGAYCKEEAKLACRVFAAVGVRSWAQKVLGWKAPTVNVDSSALILAKLEEVLCRLDVQEQELKLFRPAYDELQQLNKSFDELRNLKSLLEDIAKVIDKPNQKTNTIRGWLKFLSLDNAVDTKKSKAIGRLISDWLKVGQMENYVQSAKPAKYPEALVPLIKLATEYQLFHAR